MLDDSLFDQALQQYKTHRVSGSADSRTDLLQSLLQVTLAAGSPDSGYMKQIVPTVWILKYCLCVIDRWLRASRLA